MGESRTFAGYFLRFLKMLWKDATPWARDNIVWAVAVLILPLALAYYRNPHQAIDWGLFKTTLWFYLTAFGIYLVFQATRTAWKLDVKHVDTIEPLRQDIISHEEEMSKKEAGVSSAEWLSLADRFKEIVFYVRADWQTTRGATTWTLHDRACCSLCTLAGSLLLRSPELLSCSFSSQVSQPSPMDRWLQYVKELKGSVNLTYGTETLDDGTTVNHYLGSIEVTKNSANMCIECAASSIAGVLI